MKFFSHFTYLFLCALAINNLAYSQTPQLNRTSIEDLNSRMPQPVEIPIHVRVHGALITPSSYSQQCIKTRISKTLLKLDCDVKFVEEPKNITGTSCANGLLAWALPAVRGYSYSDVYIQASGQGYSNTNTVFTIVGIENNPVGGDYFALVRLADVGAARYAYESFARCHTTGPGKYEYIHFSALFTLTRAP